MQTRFRQSKRRQRQVGAVVIAAVSVFGSARVALAATVGSWQMNEPSGSTQMLDSVVPGHQSLPFIGVVTNGSTYTFPGWTNNIDATGRLVGVLADPAIGEIRVPDPSGSLSPGGGSFSVALRLQPTLTSGALPIPGDGSLAIPSYNILQRGRATDAGGFYKLELIGYGTKLGKVHCGMKAPGFNSLDVYSARIIDGNAHTIECSLDRLARVLKITTDGVVSGTKSFSSYGTILPRDQYGTYLTVGKKPGSTDPGDAFAGSIDYVTINR